MLKKLKQMPLSIAVGVMVVCILAGVTLGNRNALNRAKADSGATLTAVTQHTAERATQAGNLVKLAERLSPDDPIIAPLKTAIAELKAANTPSGITQADQALTAACEAARTALAGKGSEQDAKLLTGLLDTIASEESMITFTVREYNAALVTVQDVYDSLPTKWIQAAPEVFVR